MPVDLQEKRQLDLGRQVARVKAHTRPWRSIIATVLALAAAVVSIAAGRTIFRLGHVGPAGAPGDRPLHGGRLLCPGAHGGDRFRWQVA